jgi:hypothetical protein
VGIRFNERVLIVGPTESGKSELANVLFSRVRCQRLLYDSKMGGEWAVAGVEPVSAPDAIDWSAPIIHYVPASADIEEGGEVFARCCRRRNLVVCVHELNDLTGYQTQRTPESVNRYLAQGAANGLGLIGASQEPVDMPKRARSMIQHAFTMAPPIDEEHLKVVCRIVSGISAGEMRAEILATEAEHGEHSFIHWPRGAKQEPHSFPPLPSWMLGESVVKRKRPHARERSR